MWIVHRDSVERPSMKILLSIAVDKKLSLLITKSDKLLMEIDNAEQRSAIEDLLLKSLTFAKSV